MGINFNILFIGAPGVGKTQLIEQELLGQGQQEKTVSIMGNMVTFQFKELNEKSPSLGDEFYELVNAIGICIDMTKDTDSIDRDIFEQYNSIPKSFWDRVKHQDPKQRTAVFIVGTKVDALKKLDGSFDEESFEEKKTFLRKEMRPAYAKEVAAIFVTSAQDPYNLFLNQEIEEFDYRDIGLPIIADKIVTERDDIANFLISAMMTIVLLEKQRMIQDQAKGITVTKPKSEPQFQESSPIAIVPISISKTNKSRLSAKSVAAIEVRKPVNQSILEEPSFMRSFVALHKHTKNPIRTSAILTHGFWSRAGFVPLTQPDRKMLKAFGSSSLLATEADQEKFKNIYKANNASIRLPDFLKPGSSIVKLNNLYAEALREKSGVYGGEIFKCLNIEDRKFLLEVLRKKEQMGKAVLDASDFEPRKLNGTQSVLLAITNTMKRRLIYKPKPLSGNSNMSFG